MHVYVKNMHVSGMKIHMGLHFPPLIHKLGVACGWDMTMYERDHKPLKKIFKRTSQKVKTTPLEIVNRIERREVIGNAVKAVAEHRGLALTRVREVIHKSEAYTTESGVVFRASCSREVSVRVVWNHRLGVFETGERDVAYINPVVTVPAVSGFLEVELTATMKHMGEKFSMRDLKMNSTDCELLLVRSFRVESASQGYPDHSLICHTGEVETVGCRARRKRQFDWISINGINYMLILIFYMRFLRFHVLFFTT